MKNSTAREVEKLEAAMAVNPPVIVWRPNGRGVMIAWSVIDPHADHQNRKHTKSRKKSA